MIQGDNYIMTNPLDKQDKLKELFARAPTGAGYVSTDSNPFYAKSSSIWDYDLSKWRDSTFALPVRDTDHFAEIPARERELNQLADDFSFGGFSRNGFEWAEIKERRALRHPESNTPEKPSSPPYSSWDEIDEDLKKLLDLVPESEWKGREQSKVVYAPMMGDKYYFVVDFAPIEPKFSFAQWQCAKDLQPKDDSHSDGNGNLAIKICNLVAEENRAYISYGKALELIDLVKAEPQPKTAEWDGSADLLAEMIVKCPGMTSAWLQELTNAKYRAEQEAIKTQQARKIWKAEDIKPGMWICRESYPEDCDDISGLCSVTYKVGYLHFGGKKSRCLVSITDGLTVEFDFKASSTSQADEILASSLNSDAEGFRLLTNEQVMRRMAYLSPLTEGKYDE